MTGKKYRHDQETEITDKTLSFLFTRFLKRRLSRLKIICFRSVGKKDYSLIDYNYLGTILRDRNGLSKCRTTTKIH